MRKEAKSMTKEIAVVWKTNNTSEKKKPASLQDLLIESKADLAAAQEDPGDALESTRESYNQFQEDKVVTMDDSKDKSIKAMDEDGIGLQIKTRL